MNSQNSSLLNPSIIFCCVISLLMAACSNEENSETVLTAGEIKIAENALKEEKVNGRTISASLLPTDPDCDQEGNISEQTARARDLASRKYAPSSLNCAAMLYTNLALGNAEEMDLQNEAMIALEDALFYLRVIQTLDLMGVDKLNTERIIKIGSNYRILADAAYEKSKDDTRMIIHKALSARESTGSYDTELLQQAITKEPGALQGLAQVRLGRMLFELPSILGGDFDAAIKLFEQSVEINPQNMQALYYLAEVYEQELEEKKAAETMSRMLAVQPDNSQLQMSTDMLRLAIGLSSRIGETELSDNLKEKREVILASSPELMTRVSIAVGGHGGEHPLVEQ